MTRLVDHPERDAILRLLAGNVVLHQASEAQMRELVPRLEISECRKGEPLLLQGTEEMEQYFLLEGVMKRVVSNPQGKEMILRFSRAGDIETSFAAWRLKTPAPYSIVAVTRARVAKLPLPLWVAFIERYPALRAAFELEVMALMSDILGHIITLHLLDAPGRVLRFLRKKPQYTELVPRKELASYLNLSAETLSRLQSRGKVQLK
jgi:CRP-like cAMP-binding protein